mgnify:CR=1 FL=1
MKEYHDGTALGLRIYMFHYWTKYQNRRFLESYWPAFTREVNKKNIFSIIIDMIRLTFFWKCVPYHYFRYGLYNKALSYDNILRYLPETVFYYKILGSVLSSGVN